MTEQPTPQANDVAGMSELLDEITARVGIDGSLDGLKEWDFRDVWLGRCVSYIRSLQAQNAQLTEEVRKRREDAAKMTEKIIYLGAEEGCEDDRDDECVSCQTWNFLESLHFPRSINE